MDSIPSFSKDTLSRDDGTETKNYIIINGTGKSKEEIQKEKCEALMKAMDEYDDLHPTVLNTDQMKLLTGGDVIFARKIE